MNQKPNILWIMSDDHAAHAIGAYGGRLAPLDPTPTLDRIAREGIVLQNAFCTNSICSPSRASILTGQHAHVNGVRTLDEPLPPERQYLPKLMREAGYETAMIGKWHLSAEPAAFDHYCVFPGQGAYFNPIFHDKRLGAWPDNVRHVVGSINEDRQHALHSSDAVVNNTDMAPTLLDYAGVETPDYMQGRSFRPILEGATPKDWPTSTYYRYWMHLTHHDNPAHFGVRTKDWKLIFFYGLPLDAAGALPVRCPSARRPAGNSTTCGEIRRSGATCMEMPNTQKSRPS